LGELQFALLVSLALPYARFAPFTLYAPSVSFVPYARFASFIQASLFVPAVLLVEPKTQHRGRFTLLTQGRPQGRLHSHVERDQRPTAFFRQLVQHSRQFVLARFRSDATQGGKVRFHLCGRFRYVRIVDGIIVEDAAQLLDQLSMFVVPQQRHPTQLEFLHNQCFQQNKIKNPCEARGVLSACGTERIVLHKAKQVCRFAGIATYCLHKAERVKTDVRKGRENCSRTKIKFGKGAKNLSDRENNVRKGGATLHNTKNDAWKRAQRCSDAKITLFSKIHTTMKRKTSILRLYYKTISIPSYAKRVSGKTACASRRRASNSVYRDEK